MTCLGCGTPAPGGWSPCVSVDAYLPCAATEIRPEISGDMDERSGKIAGESGPFRLSPKTPERPYLLDERRRK